MHLTTDIALVVGSALIAALFLGGPMLPLTLSPAWLNGAVGFGLFVVKTLAILFVLSSTKVATGRLRIDQLNDIGWKYIASAALIQSGTVLIINYLWVTPLEFSGRLSRTSFHDRSRSSIPGRKYRSRIPSAGGWRSAMTNASGARNAPSSARHRSSG
jgi:hypothetical protein